MSQRWRPWSPLNQIPGESHNIGMTININCQFKTPELLHLDHKLSANAVEPNDKKIRRIMCFPVTDEKRGVQRLLGLVNYVVIFIPNFSEMTTLEFSKFLKKKGGGFNFFHKKGAVGKIGGRFKRGGITYFHTN